MIAFDPIYTHPVPQNHRFPMEKYSLLYEALLWEGIAEPTDFFTPEPASFEHLILAHSPTYVRQFLSLTLPQREAIRIGFQQSEQLVRRLKFGLRKAFFICFEMTTTTKGLSASQVARRYEISRQTAHYFMQKVREAMKSSESHKMDDRVQVDEFTIGGKEEGKQGRSYDTKKKKVLCAIQLSNQGKVKRFYAFKIPDYSSKSL